MTKKKIGWKFYLYFGLILALIDILPIGGSSVGSVFGQVGLILIIIALFKYYYEKKLVKKSSIKA